MKLNFCESMTNFDQSCNKLKTMDNCCKEFIFVIIKRINIQILTFCRRHFYDQKREFDVILMCNAALHVIVFSAFGNLKSASCKTHHSHTSK